MGDLTITINSVGVSVHEPSQVVINDRTSMRSTAQFTVVDTSGTLDIVQNQVVVITDSVRGDLFEGYVDTIARRRLMSSTAVLYDVTCKDKHYLADKRIYVGAEKTGRLSGDVVAELWKDYLEVEGVTAETVIDHDYDDTTFGAGTNTNVSVVKSGIELTPAGTSYAVTETDYSTGTLSATQSVESNTHLQLLPSPNYGTNALKLVGSCQADVSLFTITTNAFVYVQFWNNGGVSTASGDYLEYEIWISSTSPEIVGGMDLMCTDGTNFRDRGGCDQFQIPQHPNQDLSGFANDRWYYRKIPIGSDFTGKTISYATIVLEGDTPGDYTIYVRNPKFKASGGSTKATFYSYGAPDANVIVSNTGYHDVTLSEVQVFDSTGYRISPTYTNNDCDILRDSLISWEEELTDNPGRQVEVDFSYDGGKTWQQCSNHAPIPNMIPGMRVDGKSLLMKQILSIGGSNPELTPKITNCSFVLNPSYTQTKTDVIDSDSSDADFGGGTLTNLTASSGLRLPGYRTNWKPPDGNLSGCTLYGGESPTMDVKRGFLHLWQTNLSDALVRCNGTATYTNCIVEADIILPSWNGYWGVLWRTTGWGSAANSWGWWAGFNSTEIIIGYGTNDGVTDSFTQVGSASFPFSLITGSTYHLKVIANGTNHKVYLDDILYLNVTNSTYNSAGGVGIRVRNDGLVYSQDSYIEAFGVMSGTTNVGTRVAPSFSISGAGTLEGSIIQWNADVPEDTTLLIESSVDGGSTYKTCTNNSTIPDLVAGYNASGKSLLIRATFTAPNITYTPVLQGITSLIVSQFTTSGTRTSTAMSASPITHAFDATMSWLAIVPTDTTLTVQTSIDGSTWQTATSEATVTGINALDTIYIDGYDTDTSADYTSTYWSGGANSTKTFTSSRLQLTGGTNALFVWNDFTAKNLWITAILSRSENGCIVARYTDAANHYYVRVVDASSSAGNPHTISLWKRVSGSNTQLGTYHSISFTRDTYHTIALLFDSTTIKVIWDGDTIIDTTDSAISAVGKAGFLTLGTGLLYTQSLQAQPLGDDISGINMQYRMTLASTNPLVTPRVIDATLAARSGEIMGGETLPSTSFKYTRVAANIDTCARVSNMWWGINKDGKLYFQNRDAQPAPWPLSTTDLQAFPAPRLISTSPMYRNRQYITGAYDIVSISEEKLGDGVTQAWIMKAPIMSMTSLTVNGQSRTFGIQDVDTGVEFYWKPDDATLIQDSNYYPLAQDTETLSATYDGKVDYTAMAESTSQQTALAAIDGSSGIVEEVEVVNDMDKDTADALAAARIAQYAHFYRNFAFPTLRSGLAPGQRLTAFIPELELNDIDFLILGVKSTISTNLTVFEIDTSEGPPIGSWSRYFDILK